MIDCEPLILNGTGSKTKTVIFLTGK